MSTDRRTERRELLDQVVALQMQCQTCPDVEIKAALAQAREALRLFDEESLRLFNREVSGGTR